MTLETTTHASSAPLAGSSPASARPQATSPVAPPSTTVQHAEARSLNATTQRLIDDLAATLASEGFASAEGGVRGLAAQASALGVSDSAIGVLIDRSEPEIVRLRAFATVTAKLAVLLDCA